MGQLIDKTALRKELSKLPSEMGFVRKSDVMQILGEQKCAYDVDKVVEKLEEVKNKDTEIALDEAQKERCFWYAQGMNRAIEIVKCGGMNGYLIKDDKR